MGYASQINHSQNSVRVERRSDLNDSDLGKVYCTSEPGQTNQLSSDVQLPLPGAKFDEPKSGD